ncbi:hypothetical protein F4780DRAFT_786044 [Xylariomycetidae sp. FL0641]|nr:hypothetical protein F4780DRAFT_786044 [Xylariomycetidae sp. FL0641]
MSNATSAPAPLPPVQSAKKWIQSWYRLRDSNYNWEPACTALAETFTDIKGHEVPPPPPRSPGAQASHVREVQLTAAEIAKMKKPDEGGWAYVRYIPDWTDPDYDENLIRRYNGEVYRNTGRDSFINARPALRVQDAAKNPTPYALRFGMHPDEERGRSRMSPTSSATRHPFEDYEHQVDALEEDTRTDLIDMSQQMWKSLGRPEMDRGKPIATSILEAYLNRSKRVGNVQLFDRLRDELAKPGANLELFRDQLEEPVLEAHKNYFFRLSRDQMYQRLVFNNLTMDEMNKWNIFTMADDGFKCDLPLQIHELFERNRWNGSENRGRVMYKPRWCYNLSGVREEYNVQTNDQLWEALQPALRLLTTLINCDHPFLGALLNMNTRQKIDPSLDPRPEPKRSPLVKFVPERAIGTGETWAPLEELRRLGYDWKAETLRVLRERLTLDINSVFVSPTEDPSAPNGVDIIPDGAYGVTSSLLAGPDTKINIQIGAEMIWPLLCPEFSQSEKMATSFAIATTLLHEFAHAIHKAQQILVHVDEGRPFDDGSELGAPLIDAYLIELAGEFMFDVAPLYEPFWRDDYMQELGFAFEKEMFGMNFNTLFMTDSDHIKYMPLAITSKRWPWSNSEVSVDERLKGAVLLKDLYERPVPLDFMARLFTDDFWQHDFQKYGHAAIKEYPSTMMIPKTGFTLGLNTDSGKKLYGEEEWGFLRTVPALLRETRHSILSLWLTALHNDSVRATSLLSSWTRTVSHSWYVGSQQAAKVDRFLDDTVQSFQDCRTVNQYWNNTPENQQWIYNGLVEQGMVEESFDDWLGGVHRTWQESFRDGGLLMRYLRQVNENILAELEMVENIVFAFLGENKPTRAFLSGASSPLQVVRGRIVLMFTQCSLLVDACHAVAAMPSLAGIQAAWAYWTQRMTTSQTRYRVLGQLLDDAANIDPNAVSWKAKFQTVLSANWYRQSARLEVLAMPEYHRLDPRVRAVVDDWFDMLRRHAAGFGPAGVGTGAALEEPELDATMANLSTQFAQQAQKMRDTPRGIFDFAGTAGQRPAQGDLVDVTTPRPSTSTSTPAPAPAAPPIPPPPPPTPHGIQFGKASRRGPSPKKGAAAGAKASTGAGVSKSKKKEESRAAKLFRQYVEDAQGFRQVASKALYPGSVSHLSGAAEAVNTLIPAGQRHLALPNEWPAPPAPWSPTRRLFSGVPAADPAAPRPVAHDPVGGFGSGPLPPAARQPAGRVAPFAAPGADRTVLSTDLHYHAQARLEALGHDHLTRQAAARERGELYPTAFQGGEAWRDPRPPVPDDEDDDNNGIS